MRPHRLIGRGWRKLEAWPGAQSGSQRAIWPRSDPAWSRHLTLPLPLTLTRFFVESDELRTRREGTFLRGALVEVVTAEFGECYPGGRIDEYDDESGTFTVRRFDTGGLGRLYYVAADEVRGISYF